MEQRNIGILHPGQMGVSIAAAAKKSGHKVYWACAGRSAQSRARAAEQGLLDARTLAELCATCEILISVCPPHAAEDLAAEVIVHNFQGTYLDANAIAPQPAVASVIAGATSPEQVVANAASAEWALSAEDRTALDEIVASPHPERR